ncbi:MAG: type II secretion system ATPase GspE [Maricaulaceae bacterium]|jgi:general secretion pathway protein E
MPDVESHLTYSFAKEHGVARVGPRDPEADAVVVAVREGAAPHAIIEARRALGRPLVLERLDREAFERRLAEIYATTDLGASGLDEELSEDGSLHELIEGISPTADLLDSESDAPVIKLINGLIAEAVRMKASDIHVEPYEDRLAIRFRVDGVLREVLSHSRALAPLISSRIKVMARLDIAEKRTPQDGRVSLSFGGRSIDVRVSTLPSRFGERVVLRLLDKDQSKLDLDELGMDATTLSRFKTALNQPNGIVLVTGPTGSGKTTTLYAALSLLNDASRNILTVEDPIEYGLDGVGQTQVNAKVGMSFASGLRSILRQDPDIVMVGEIRDVETAQVAVQASLTGHLVLSTVHTNSAAAAITRLRDMGVEPFLLASTVTCVVAQRLVRRLCAACKEPYEPDAAELASLGLQPGAGGSFHHARGCEACNNTGYAGRLGIYELMSVDDEIRRMIHEDARESEIEAHAFASSDTLLRNGARQAAAGLTTSAEVLRTCRQAGGGDGGV